MAVTIALKTLQLIDQLIEADQGASFRQWEGRVIPHIGDAFRGEEEGHRSHLGASIIGGECAAAIWHSWRWSTKPRHKGRTLRLFNRGHIEEGRFIAMLLMLGCEFWQQDAEGKQYRISWAEGHAGGSGDGIGRGIPDLPSMTAFVAEFKTHGEKSFIELAGKLDEWRAHVEGRGPFTGQGVRSAKFEHFVQMQTYMRKMGIPAALYCAVCKNTDDVYMEIVTLDTEFADQFLGRGEQIVWMDTPPSKINNSPGFYKCRFCDHKPVCHLKAAPDRNCRTCEHSRPIADAKWHCAFNDRAIDKETQLTGCNAYEVSKNYG